MSAATTVNTEYEVKSLTEQDIDLLVAFGPASDSPVAKVRDRHHAIARLLAIGLTNNEVCEVVGVSPPWLATLRKSPLFQQLIADYHDKVTQKLVLSGIVERVRAVSIDYLEEVHRRLHQGEDIEFRHLSATTMSLLDRAGVGPTSRVESARGGLSDTDLDQIKRSIREDEIVVSESPRSDRSELVIEGSGLRAQAPAGSPRERESL